ncbi:hypothetical protein FRC18_010432 [Serendipita sp. 400]|nr:hypothetical protein FRC18_010432 [Serendipita sp. 400]
MNPSSALHLNLVCRYITLPSSDIGDKEDGLENWVVYLRTRKVYNPSSRTIQSPGRHPNGYSKDGESGLGDAVDLLARVWDKRIKQERRQFPNLLPIVSSTPVSHQRPSANAPRGFQDRIIRSQVTRLSLLYPTDAFWGTSSAELTSPIDWLPENALEKIPEAKNREQTVEEPKDLGRGIEEVAEICGLGELETRTRASLLAEERVYYFLWDLDKQAKGVESNAGYTVPFPLGPNCVSPYHTHTHICLRG